MRILFILLFTSFLYAQPYVIKMATFAPEKSPWMAEMKKMAAELEKESGGSLILRFYPGGMAGTDQEVLEKMKKGKLQAAGLTSMGLGEILPEIRVMESPFAFSSYREFDFVLHHLSENFKAKLLQKGYVLLGWTDQGFVYLLSRRKIDSCATMSETSPWVWKNDPVALSIAQSFRAACVPLEPEEVRSALEKGRVDTVYMTPLATLFFQWYAHVRYLVDMPVANAVGAILLSKDDWDKLPTHLQHLLQEKAASHTSQMVHTIRDLNDKAILVFQKKEIQILKLSSEERALFQKKGMAAAESLVGKLYSKELLEEVKKWIAEVVKQ